MRLEQAVAGGFRQIVELLEMHGADPGDLDVFRNLADTLPAATPANADNNIVGDPALGERAVAGIVRYLESGELPRLDDVVASVPPAVAALLRTKAPAARPQFTPQFTPLFTTASRRHRLQRALPLAERISAHLAGCSGVSDTTIVGDCRRGGATVNQIEILASSDAPRVALQEASADLLFSNGRRVDENTLTLFTQDELPVAVQFSPSVAYGAALARYTGSPAHCAAVDRLATAANLRFTPQGIDHEGRRVVTRRESDVYALLDLDWMEPELREDRGEIEAARNGQLPDLVDLATIRGDLHCRPRDQAALAELAQAAATHGWEYLAITLPASERNNAHEWLDMVERFHAQRETPCLLKSAECPILEDGSLDLPPDVLARLDLGVCRVQSHFALGQRRQTERFIRAMDHPACTVLAALAGARENPRYAIDMERIVRAARARGCLLEIDAEPARPEIQELYLRMAREIGVGVMLGSGAEHAGELGMLRFALLQARRGWLESAHIVNTLPVEELRQRLRHA